MLVVILALFELCSVVLPITLFVFVSITSTYPLVTGFPVSLSVMVTSIVVFLIVLFTMFAFVLDSLFCMLIVIVSCDVLYSLFPLNVTVTVFVPTGRSTGTVICPSWSVLVFMVSPFGSVMVTGAFAIGVAVTGSVTLIVILESSYTSLFTVICVCDALLDTTTSSIVVLLGV